MYDRNFGGIPILIPPNKSRFEQIPDVARVGSKTTLMHKKSLKFWFFLGNPLPNFLGNSGMRLNESLKKIRKKSFFFKQSMQSFIKDSPKKEESFSQFWKKSTEDFLNEFLENFMWKILKKFQRQFTGETLEKKS